MKTLFLQKFGELPRVARSMVIIFWMYHFFQITSDIFLNVYVLLVTKSFLSLIIYNWCLFLGGFFGFGVLGIILTRYGREAKLYFYLAFSMYFMAYVYLFFAPQTFLYLCIFSIIQGIALGLFWLGMHAYEVHFLPDRIRDFYSSVLQSGNQFLSIVTPFLVTSILVAFGMGDTSRGYTILFAILPLVCLGAFPLIKKMPSFTPKKLSFDTIRHIDRSHARKSAKLYFFTSAYPMALLVLMGNLVALYVLTNVVNIGIWETIFGVISLGITLFLAPFRSASNRIIVMLYASLGLILAAVCLMMSGTHIILYVIFSLLYVIFRPILRVSSHTIDLWSMESVSGPFGGYAGMIYREWMLFVGRTCMAAIMVFAGIYVTNNSALITASFALFAILMIVQYICARRIFILIQED